MWLFYVLLLLPMAIQHFSLNKKTAAIHYEQKNQWALAVFFILLTFLVMFRHESVGNDTRNYIHIFKISAATNWQSLNTASWEIGYSYLCKLVSLISNHSRALFISTASLTSIMLYPTYRRLCADASLTIVLFCSMSTFVMMFSGIRQMLAIGIGCIAYECARRNKLIYFILCVLLATSLHTSAFMLIFMYPLYHARITVKWLWIVIPVVIVSFIFNEQIFSVLALFIEQYTEYDAAISQTGAYTMIALFALLTAFSFLVADDSKLDSETIGLRNFLLLSLVLQMFAPLNSLAMRMGYYYIIFIPLLLPKIIHNSSAGAKQIAIMGRHIMLVFFTLYFFVAIVNGDNNLHVFPYHFFWENV